MITIIQQHRYDCYIIYHKEHRVYASICLFSLSIAPHYTVITVSFLSSILGSDLVYARSFSSSYYTERTSSTTLSTKNSNRKYEISANNFHNLFGAQNKKHHPGIFLNHSAMPTDDDNNGRTSFVLCPSSFFIIVPFR